jgi:hypothetical protein
MSERDTETRLEHELRALLHAREPGPAPYALRGRADRIPEEVGVAVRWRGRLARLAPLLAAPSACLSPWRAGC